MNTEEKLATLVRVKPLQFRDETGDGVLTSRETGELFRIFPQADGTFFAPKLDDDSAPDAQTLIDRLNARHAARILAALEPAPATMAELVGALQTVRDYVDDALRGTLRYRGEVDISELAKQDAARIDAVLARVGVPT